MKAPPDIKGWCPDAYRAMESVDGLVIRLRPRLARLDCEQVLGLCDLAMRYGSGFLDLTNRANLQIRGVAAADHDALLQGLQRLDFLDRDPLLERRRNILTTPFWADGDLTHRLNHALIAALPRLPDLPDKVGFAVDTGPQPVLQDCPADFRLERGIEDRLILRADGTVLGRKVDENTAIDALIEMAHWFAKHCSSRTRRMARLLTAQPLPAAWAQSGPRPADPRPGPGCHPLGALYGAPFGQIAAQALGDTIRQSGARAIRVTPWRLFLLEGAALRHDTPFVTRAADPLLRADACPGAPLCPQATVETRNLARALVPQVSGDLHVSGCAKGCARARPADFTLVGRNGRFDLVKNGTAADTPMTTGHTPKALLDQATWNKYK